MMRGSNDPGSSVFPASSGLHFLPRDLESLAGNVRLALFTRIAAGFFRGGQANL